jgi:diadenosine tetraphosphate (Ap4A) HIT family hydrolase
MTDYFSLRQKRSRRWPISSIPTKRSLDDTFQSDGYNIGAAAGQSMMQCHCHIIPRYRGDTDNPKGGIRRVIAGRYYKDNAMQNPPDARDR